MPFTDSSWSSPESDLSPEAFCSCCLIDNNPKGADKTKGNCYLPVRSRPGGPYNKNAIRAALGGHGIMRVKGVPAEKKRAAARSLVRLAAEADIDVGPSIRRLAGMKAK